MRLRTPLLFAFFSSSIFLCGPVVADVTVPPAVGPFTTSVDGNVNVLPTGQINVAGDAITVDDADRNIVLDSGNTTAGNDAIVATGVGINIVAGGTPTGILIGAGTDINTTGGTDGILVQDDMATINNAGRIDGGESAIHITTGGTNTTITNQATGVMQGGNSQTILVQDTGMSLTNSGIILNSTSGGAAPIRVEQNFNFITNEFGGFIVGNTINGINLTGVTAISGDVTNAGNISSGNGAGNGAIIISGEHTGTITNTTTGVIESTGSSSAIQANATFGNIINEGLIEATAAGGNAVVYGAGVGGGTFTNSGIIQSNNIAPIQLAGTPTQFVNSGTIASTAGFASAVEAAANTVMSGGFLNSGDITPFGVNAILFGPLADVDIPLFQSGGTIAGHVLLASAGDTANGDVFTMTGGVVTGNVTATHAGASSSTFNLSGGAIGGTVQLDTAGDVVNLSGASIQNIVGGLGNDEYNILAGSMTDLLDNAGQNELNVSGGTVAGFINFSGPLSGPNTLTLSGGTVGGTITLGDNGDLVILSGSAVQQINGGPGNDLFILTGGSFTGLDGIGGANEIDVDASFTSTGPISNVQTIEVNNAGTVFTVQAEISDVTTSLTTDPGTSIIFDANITSLGGGPITNNGTLQVNDGFDVNTTNAIITNNGTVTMGNNGAILRGQDFTQNAGANYNVQLSTTSAGLIDLSGNANLAATSTVSPVFEPGVFLPAGTVFDVLRTPAGNVLDLSTLGGDPFPLIFFTKSGPIGAPCVGGTCVQLTSGRNPYGIGALTQCAQSVAATLDGLVPLYPNIDPHILAVLGQIDGLTSLDEINNALEQLTPSCNYGIVMASHISMENAFDSVQHRLADIKGVGTVFTAFDEKLCRDDDFYNGMNCYKPLEGGVPYGDIAELSGGVGTGSVWFKAYGNAYDQKTRQSVPGYQGDAAGLAIGADWRLSHFSAIGAAFSYTYNNLHDTTAQRNAVDIDSGQVTFYGWFEPYDAFYMDAMIGIASHKYDTSRNIGIGDFGVNNIATFYGLEYGVQMDAGYAYLTADDLYVAPFIRLRYTYLNMDPYSETGAGGLSLSVNNSSVRQAIGGAGFRIAKRLDYVEAIYVPELWAVLLYDFAGESQEMVSNFLGGGVPFYTSSPDPSLLIGLIGVGLNTYTSDNFGFNVKFNLEIRDQFLGYNLYGQLQYTWG